MAMPRRYLDPKGRMRDGFQRAHITLRAQLTLESMYFGEEVCGFYTEVQ